MGVIMAIITISLPDKMIAKLDELKETAGYMSRSEIIRDALKQYFTKEELKKAKKVLSSVLILSKAKESKKDGEILKIVHKNADMVVGFNHIHLEGHCVETVTCVGDADKIQEVIRGIRKLRNVISVREAIVPI